MKNYEIIGSFKNYPNASIISNGEKFYVNDDREWNGEKYFNCFEIDKNLIDVVDDTKYVITPVYKEIDYDEFEIIDYEIDRM